MQKITVTPFIRNLFCNVPIEGGLTDAEILSKSPVKIAPQTFSRHRIHPPRAVPAEELVAVARAAQARLGIDAAAILAKVRERGAGRCADDFTRLQATSVATSAKDRSRMEKLAKSLAYSSSRIYLFDRSDSFPYLRPEQEELGTDEVNSDESSWRDKPPAPLRYARRPRVSVLLTADSLRVRHREYGDEGIEQLLGNLEIQEHSLSIIDDSPRRAHRVFRGVLADVMALTIFDRRAMIVYPQHERSFRVYDADRNVVDATLIREAIAALHRLRRFRMHSSRVSAIAAFLKSHLSYVRAVDPVLTGGNTVNRRD
ncbi:MAG: hypothetical protein KatS3mg104_1538 [Phycisphaerae bacterium]|nr:MAG: hypothetical protein KatS3mg104_1538 [Phycisphaerae bacterium]